MSKKLLLLSLLVILLLSACQGALAAGPPDVTPQADDPMAADAAATEAPLIHHPVQPEPAGSEACPAWTDNTVLYVNEDNGYCFLYPASFTPDTAYPAYIDVALVGPPLADNESPEPILAVLTMNTIAGPGAASGLDLEGYVRGELTNLGPIGSEVTTEPATIGGASALIAHGPLGFGESRAAYLLANDTLYVLFNNPIHADQAEIQADADLIWNMVTDTLTFFDVPVVDTVTPGEVCPSAGDGETLYVNHNDGYCLLIPASFGAEEGWPGVFAGGPEIPDLPEWMIPADQVSISVSCAASVTGVDDGRTAVEAAQERVSANPDVLSIVDEAVTVDGADAVILLDNTENLGQRIALVNRPGMLCSVLVKPTNANLYPEAQPTADDVWALALDSLRFFEPWR